MLLHLYNLLTALLADILIYTTNSYQELYIYKIISGFSKTIPRWPAEVLGILINTEPSLGGGEVVRALWGEVLLTGS